MLEKSSQEENVTKTWEDEGMANNQEDAERQLIAYTKPLITIPPINLLSRFDALANLSEEQLDDKEEELVHSKGTLTEEVESESETELVLDDARKELHCNYLLGEDATKDSGDIGMNESAVEDMRLVVSDGEGKRKKRGRPRGSKTGVKIQDTETRRSTRLQGDSPQKNSQ
ncbi:OLC1v1013233C1 [Oldenlandia corymbosa var. corymbosa]|uniref:OLC1v1013233C1 n=1 Tax=Oldenlandia corymbosa var. corymbosa TaxID=529605 RepID=A0AAV1DY09_OLDCO|nr:OLC1v1013233C1 [Oldenlandia corymbosa var. corymbosa]